MYERQMMREVNIIRWTAELPEEWLNQAQEITVRSPHLHYDVLRMVHQWWVLGWPLDAIPATVPEMSLLLAGQHVSGNLKAHI